MATAIPAKVEVSHLQFTSKRFYRPELDALRFFAFFSVFLTHTLPGDAAYYSVRNVPCATLVASIASAGRFGVDLFFFLSAYLITELLLQEKETFGRISLRSFYWRRILRIWPLYFLGIFIAVLLTIFDHGQTFPFVYAAAFLLLAGNWLISLRCAGILSVADASTIMFILWSVSFEEQFYLFWPAMLAKAKSRKTILAVALALPLISGVARLVLLHFDKHSEAAIFTNTLTRLDPLALGIIAAMWLHKNKVRFRKFLRVAFLAAGCGLWMAAGHFYSLTLSFMVFGYPAMALGAGFIFLSVFRMTYVPSWLRYLGKISYGLYVFHMLALYLSLKFLGAPHNFQRFVPYWFFGLTLTLIFAALSYRFFESPFLRLKERFALVKSRPV